jgi:hypothetical protein
VQPVVILRREVQVGEAAVAELGCQRAVAADQLGDSEAMPLGLQDVLVVDSAELADRAV